MSALVRIDRGLISTKLVVAEIVGWRVARDGRGGVETLVMLRGVEQPYAVHGNHDHELSLAVEAWREKHPYAGGAG